jgi:truncated hemoglobin YjbI
MDADAVPTLFDWAGGQAAIRRLIDRFYAGSKPTRC